MPKSLVGHVPDAWNVTTLGELCISGDGGIQTGPFGSQLHAADYISDGIPSVMPQNIGDNEIIEDGIARISEADAQRLSRYQLKAGDIVYSRRGDVERRAFVRPREEGWLCGTGCLRVRVGHAANPRFVSYYLGHPGVREWIVRHAVGATMPNLNTAILSAVQIALPPNREQAEIAALLGVLDDKVYSNDASVRIIHDLMRFYYAEAVMQGSVTTTVGDAAEVFDGPHATPQKTTAGPWFLSISSLQGGHLVLSQSAHLGEQDFTQWTRRVTPTAGDVLFSYETRLGEAALMPSEVRACLGRRMALLRPRAAAVGPRTLLQAYLSESFQVTIKQRSVHGATVDRIPLTELPTWPITLPDDANQLEELLGGLDDMAAQRDRENEILVDLRETLLPKLMSGEIRVRDAEKVVEEVL